MIKRICYSQRLNGEWQVNSIVRWMDARMDEWWLVMDTIFAILPPSTNHRRTHNTISRKESDKEKKPVELCSTSYGDSSYTCS